MKILIIDDELEVEVMAKVLGTGILLMILILLILSVKRKTNYGQKNMMRYRSTL